MPPGGGWSLVQEDKLSLELQSGAAIRNMGDGQLSFGREAIPNTCTIAMEA
jgi:hypothetical protein